MQIRSEGRRKKRSWFFALGAAVLILVAAKSLNYSDMRTLDLSWEYDFRQMPRCTSQSKDKCIAGFNVFVGKPTRRDEQWFVSAESMKDLRASMRIRHIGRVPVCVAAVAKDADGLLVESSPVCTERWLMPSVSIGRSAEAGAEGTRRASR